MRIFYNFGCFKSPKQPVLSLKERTAWDRLVSKFVLWPGNMCRLWTEPRIYKLGRESKDDLQHYKAMVCVMLWE